MTWDQDFTDYIRKKNSYDQTITGSLSNAKESSKTTVSFQYRVQQCVHTNRASKAYLSARLL
jgi:hypothetical protein